jgi:AbiEi antitoxin C-terminal domain
MRRAHRPAELLTGPFTAKQAQAAGLTSEQLRSSCWRRLFHGVYISADLTETVALRARAVGLVLPPGAVVGYSTAAWLRGVDVRPSAYFAAVEVIAQRGDQIRRHGVHARSALLEEEDVTRVCGVPVTTPVRTAFDLARQRDLIEAVVGVDAMLNRGGCRLDDLARYVASHRKWRGVRRADAALAHAEPLSQSPMESRQRMRLVLAGLPRPQAQVPIRDARGRAFAYIDNGYDEWRVGVDYDGEVHRDTWREDLRRQERIRDEGWWHRRYSSIDITGGWARMVEQVAAALVRAGWRG